MRVWGLPNTRKVGSQIIKSKKDKSKTRQALKRELKRIKDDIRI